MSRARVAYFVASLFFLLVAFRTFAEGGLTWEDCIKVAEQGNPDIKSAVSTYDSSRYNAKGAYSGFLPQVSGEFNYNSGSYGIGSSGSFSTSQYTASVTAQQNIFNGLHDLGTVRQTAAQRDANLHGLDSAKVQVSYDLRSAFSSLLYAQDYSKLTKDIIKRRDENAQMVRLRFEAGMENKGNMMLSAAFFEQAKFENQQAGHSIEVNRQQLARVMGKDDDTGIKISGKMPVKEPIADPEYMSMALSVPEYQKAVASEKAAKAAVTVARANFSPTLSVNASAEKDGNSWPPGTNNTSYGFNLGLPFFNGTNDYFNVRSSQSALLTAKYNREAIETKLIPQLKQTYTEFIDAFTRLKVDQAFVEAATVRADIARGKYKNGLLSFEDWDIIENDLITKQKNVLLSERALYLAEAAWEKAQGKGVFK